MSPVYMHYKQSKGSTACPAVHLAHEFPCCYSSNTNTHQYTALYSLSCAGFIFCSCLSPIHHLCFSAFTLPWVQCLCFMVLYPIISPRAYGISLPGSFYRTGAICVPHVQWCGYKMSLLSQPYCLLAACYSSLHESSLIT